MDNTLSKEDNTLSKEDNTLSKEDNKIMDPHTRLKQRLALKSAVRMSKYNQNLKIEKITKKMNEQKKEGEHVHTAECKH